MVRYVTCWSMSKQDELPFTMRIGDYTVTEKREAIYEKIKNLRMASVCVFDQSLFDRDTQW